MLFASAPILAQDSRVDIPALLREAAQKSEQNWHRVIAEYPNYSYKWRKVWRGADKAGNIEERSELYELFFPSKCRPGKCRSVTVLLEKNGKPVEAAKIERQREKVGQKIEDQESKGGAKPRSEEKNSKPQWMHFYYYRGDPSTGTSRVIAAIDGSEIIEKCDFTVAPGEIFRGRETIVLTFRPRVGTIFTGPTEYMPRTEGRIWIDAADKILVALAIWPINAKFEEYTVGYLSKNAPVFRSLARTSEGMWFPGLGRINALPYPALFSEMKDEFIIEHFDHHYFATEVKSVQLETPDKN